MGLNKLTKRVWRWLGRYGRDRRGNIAVVTALLIVPLVGVMGLATETGSWFLINRAEQHAADSAVLATAQNYLFVGTNYIAEGKSVAAQFGFVDGASNTTVTPQVNVACPAPYVIYSDCVKVSISKSIPLNFSKVVGYRGTSGLGSQSIIATATARSKDSPVSDCIFSLAPAGTDGFHINGGPSLDLTKCAVQVNGDATCNGANSTGNAFFFFVHGTNKNSNCTPSNATAPAVTDPYTTAYPRTNIPANACASPSLSTCYYQASNDYGRTGNGKGSTITQSPNTWPSTNVWNGSVAAGNNVYYGDVKLTADTTITNSGPITIYNGGLDLQGHTLTGTGVTLIFAEAAVTNANSGTFTPSHTLPSDGTLDISAPTSGTWSGVAVYQDPNMTSGVDWSSSGSGLNWKISGLIYMPDSNIQFSGAVNKATGGADCFVLVEWTFQVNGNAAINEGQSGCAAAGLNPPTSILRRPTLIN